MEAPPRCGTVEVVHELLIRVFASEVGFGKPQFKPLVTARLNIFLTLKTGYMRACLADVAAG